MQGPFESRTAFVADTHEPLLTPTKQRIVDLLRRVADDLDRLETSDSSDSYSLTAASRAVHLALVELQPCA